MPRPSTPNQVRRPTTPEIDVEPPLPVRRPRRVAPAPIQEQVAPPKRTRRETGPRRTAASVERDYQKLLDQMHLDHAASLASLHMQAASKAQRFQWTEIPNSTKWLCIATIFIIAIFAAWAEGRHSVHPAQIYLEGRASNGVEIVLAQVGMDSAIHEMATMPRDGATKTLPDGRTIQLRASTWFVLPATATPHAPARRVHLPGSKEVLADSAQTE